MTNKYQVNVDVSNTWDEDDIDVVSIVVEEENAELAYIKAQEEIVRGDHNDKIKGREYYVWSVNEDDKLTQINQEGEPYGSQTCIQISSSCLEDSLR